MTGETGDLVLELIHVPDCVMCRPADLQDWLYIEGVAELDWRKRVPDQVIAVMRAMHRAEYTDQEVAVHFQRAIDHYARVAADQDRLLTAAERQPFLGGGWTPTATSVASVRDAHARRARRAAAQAAAHLTGLPAPRPASALPPAAGEVGDRDPQPWDEPLPLAMAAQL